MKISFLSRESLLTLLAILVGVLAALGSALFRAALSQTHDLFFVTGLDLLAALGPVAVAFLPAFGGLLVGVLDVGLAGNEESYGVARIVEAMALRGGRLKAQPALVRIVSAIITLGSGGSAGLQDPNVHIGAMLGSWLGQRIRLSSARIKALVGSGAAAGIAATFNAPITGVFFALEILLGRFSSSALGVVMLASITASLVSRALRGNMPLFGSAAFAICSQGEMLLYLGLGVLTALVATFYARLLHFVGDRFAKSGIHEAWRPAAGGLIVGVIGIFFPQILGIGIPFMEALLAGQGPLAQGTLWPALASLLALALLKPLATALTLGSGGSGGIFAPSLFIGASLGAGYGLLMDALVPGSIGSPASYALVGMGGILAGTIQAPITCILFIFELTHDYRVILPIMLCATVSALLARYLNKDSVYTAPLTRRGITLPRSFDVNPMETVQVDEIMQGDVPTLRLNSPLAEMAALFSQHRHEALVVLDQEGQLAGLVPYAAFERVQETTGNVRARELVREHPATLFPDETVDDALRLLSRDDLEVIPVISRTGLNKVVGLVRSQDLIAAYNTALARQEERERRMQAMELTSRGGGSLLRVTLTPASAAVGHWIADLNLPSYGAIILYIQRGEKVVVPRGDTRLLAHDVLTIELEQPEQMRRVRTLLLEGEEGVGPLPERLREYVIPAQAPCVGRRLDALDLPADWLAVRIERPEGVFIPHGDTTLQAGDEITLFGLDPQVAELEQALFGETLGEGRG